MAETGLNSLVRLELVSRSIVQEGEGQGYNLEVTKLGKAVYKGFYKIIVNH
jgi:hypothetical protein